MDIKGLTPTRTITKVDAEHVTVHVIPPALVGGPGASVVLTLEQCHRYYGWLAGGGLIQTVFPDLSANDREILLSGVTAAEFNDLDDSKDAETPVPLDPETCRLLQEMIEAGPLQPLLRALQHAIDLVTCHVADTQDLTRAKQYARVAGELDPVITAAKGL